MRLSSIIDSIESIEEDKQELYFELATKFERKMPEALYMNHYELAKEVGSDAYDWQEFLVLPQVKAWLKKQTTSMVSANARKSLKSLEKADSQMAVSSAKAFIELDKEMSEQDNTVKFIYTHIPLSKKK